MNVKSWTARLGLALLAAVAATGVAAQTLRFGLAEDPDVLDPTLARTLSAASFRVAVRQAGRHRRKLNIVPQLATSYEWSADRKALTLKLRSGVTFHDGEKFDAAPSSTTSNATRRWLARTGAASSRRW
jgi:peptide/nickel transport system substrate-binding protein